MRYSYSGQQPVTTAGVRSLPGAAARAALHIRDAMAEPRAEAAAAEYWGRRLVVATLVCCAASFVIGFQLALTILAVIGFAAAIAGLWRPALGMLGVGMLCTMDALLLALVFTGGIFRFNTFNYWLVVVMLLSIPFILRISDIHSRILQFFILLLALQILVSADPDVGVQDVLSILVIFGLIVYFARAANEKHIWYWLGVVCGTLGVASGLAYYPQIAALPYVNPNAWGFVPLTALFAICLGYSQAREHRSGQAIMALLAVSNFAWVFLSTSRGHLLVSLCCLLYIFARTRGVSFRLGVLAGVVLLVFWVGTQYTILPKRVRENTLDRIVRLFDPNESISVRTSGRSELALAGWYIFLDNPVGAGTGSFGAEWANLGQREGLSSGFWRAGREKPAHAAWVKTLAENGVFGIILLVVYVLSFAAAGWRARERGLLPLGLLATSVLALAFISQEYQGKGLWFMAAGITVLLHREEMLFHLRGAARRLPAESIIRPSVRP